MNKRYYIYDCDFLSFPNDFKNVKGTKISSFYQQQGDKVMLIRRWDEPLFDYDRIFIIRERLESRLPPVEILDNPKAILYGKAMQDFAAYQEFPWQIAAVRPDYLLYNQNLTDRPRKDRVQYIQFYSGFHHLPVQQNFTNTFQGVKINLVVDDNFWDVSDTELLEALKKLQKYRRILFLAPIKIGRLIKNSEIAAAFKALDFETKSKNRFINNYGNEEGKLKQLILFARDFEDYKHFVPLRIQILPQLKQPLKPNQLFFRAMEIATFAKKHQVRINLTCPKYYTSYFWFYFYHLKQWVNQAPKKSYIEYMTYWSTTKTPKTMEEILNHSENWLSVNTRELLYLIATYPLLMQKYMFLEWGDEKLDIFVDYDYIRKEYRY